MADVDPKIVEAKKRAEADLLKLPGVTGVDIGYKEVGGQPTDQIAIRVLVTEKKDVPKAQQVPKEIEGIPTDVIQRRFVLHGSTARMPVTELRPMVDAGTYTPLKGGISIGPCRAIGGFVYVGTLGCIVKDRASSKHMLLSNFHVMCVDTTHSVGDAMAQPARNDGGACPGSQVGTLARQSLGGKVDCAVADITGSRGHSCEIVDIGFVAGQGVASLGQAVRKRGRTTSLTHGVVDAVAMTVSVDYGPGLGVVTLTDQIGIRPDTARNPLFGDHGDSGSVVVDDARKVIGLYFAGDDTGYGVANPIAEVLNVLNVDLCTGGLGGIKIKDIKDIRDDFQKVKDFKVEKLERKELKIEIKEKHELKEIAKLENPEKNIFEKGGKELVEGGFPDFPRDPLGPIAGPITGPIAGPIGGVFSGQAAGFKPVKELKDNSEKISLKERKLEKTEFKDHKNEKFEKNEKIEGKDKNEKVEKPEKNEKIEKPENKDKNEKLEKPEIKEAKNEKIERKELKELKIEKIENKEISKLEKLENKEISKLENPEKPGFKEKDGKELKEGGFEGPGGPGGPGDPGPILEQQASPAAFEPKVADLKPIKEFKAEKTEKIEIKDRKESKFEKNEIKELKPEKIEKNELKELKQEKSEKNEIKEIAKHEKLEQKEISKLENPEKPGFKEKDGKELKEGGFEGPGGPGGPGDPGPVLGDRLQALEEAVNSLSHFISTSLRPDLSHGALTSEPDLNAQAKSAKDAKDTKDAEKLSDR